MNKILSILDHIGHAFKHGLDVVMPIAETAGEVAVTIFAPSLGPLFNQTVAAIATAEQNAAAIGAQNGTGPQKLSAVVQLMGGLIKQTLTDVGKPNDNAAVEKYITAVVTILNAIPAPEASQPGTLTATVIEAKPSIVAQPGPTPIVSSSAPGSGSSPISELLKQ